MRFSNYFIKEIDDLGESFDLDPFLPQRGSEERERIFDGITRVIKEVATQNGTVLDEKILIRLTNEFAYCFGINRGRFWDAADLFQPSLAQIGVKRKNYKLIKESKNKEPVWIRKS
ncbi:MAG: hypothetical protein UR80_C0029G0009 [Parcubacteria group bacterium GW2011_GWB1_35_5]|uniref:Uncharacterized protein n=1 Tax=Candidatus Zambryskibacteria bacterium RIFCSPLOWO2_01_FULL_35_19 TaxID=1802757 RepID=A0A1G2TY32_9BACT|nr:MAG: hypothetical protein UR80_C0029G0009 [Parcubacteria group bacterium GW2011_GWB1_35_5]OHA86320.1 MAG: hypothetical protein A2726_01550 [Candidatus Zambryskibacteria bacterium RIFCSPHIGHO2_01_FULL_35_32]OHB01530.1 MAG: hypothetical protein A3A90_01890 [Candidatus Zambryskibacteria bacterium RIFCSPLOWO2_01_FULL_35_19]